MPSPYLSEHSGAEVDQAVSDVQAATAAATAEKLMLRDANGRAKVAAPSASDDVARKAEVDAVASGLVAHAGASDVHNATSDATASRIILRDAQGQAKVGAPTDPDHIARKQDLGTIELTYVRTSGNRLQIFNEEDGLWYSLLVVTVDGVAVLSLSDSGET